MTCHCKELPGRWGLHYCRPRSKRRYAEGGAPLNTAGPDDGREGSDSFRAGEASSGSAAMPGPTGGAA